MGLFSFLNKNKQETTAENSGYYSRDDDQVAARARSKRASSAGDGARRGKDAKAAAADPILPEKKRARRRLVGAIALALAVAVGLPMLLDAEPKPLAGDIAIVIPSKDKAAPLPLPAAAPAPAVPEKLAAADTLDKREEIVEPARALAPPPVAEVHTAPAAAPEHKAAPKAEPKPVEQKTAEIRAEKAKLAAKADDKPAAKPAAPQDDPARALAILEGKPADKHAAEAGVQKFAVQVAALGSTEKAAELQGRLKEAGIHSYTQKGSADHLIRVRVGPFSRDDAARMRVKLDKMGLTNSMVPI